MRPHRSQTTRGAEPTFVSLAFICHGLVTLRSCFRSCFEPRTLDYPFFDLEGNPISNSTTLPGRHGVLQALGVCKATLIAASSRRGWDTLKPLDAVVMASRMCTSEDCSRQAVAALIPSKAFQALHHVDAGIRLKRGMLGVRRRRN